MGRAGGHREPRCCDPIHDWIGIPARGDDAQLVELQESRLGAAGPRSRVQSGVHTAPTKAQLPLEHFPEGCMLGAGWAGGRYRKGTANFFFQYSLVCVR